MLACRRLITAHDLAGAAGLSTAHAQNTEFVLEASSNEGQTWASEVSASPGTTVYIRARVCLANAGTNPDRISPAFIHVIPSPGFFPLVGLLAIARRRRCP